MMVLIVIEVFKLRIKIVAIMLKEFLHMIPHRNLEIMGLVTNAM